MLCAGGIEKAVNFICSAHHTIKGPEHKPTIGILLCRTPNETVVKYALQGIDAPMGITEYQFNNDYQLTKAIPNDLQSELPTIEALEQELEREVQIIKKPLLPVMGSAPTILSFFQHCRIL